jgi:adenosine deaminase
MARTELHRHLDASVRPATLAELIGAFHIDAPYTTEKAVREGYWLTRQMASLKEVLDRFQLFQKVLKTTEVLERLGREAVEDVHAEGTANVEFRYSPAFTSELSGIDWSEALNAFERGVWAGCKATGVRAGLICIASRESGLEQVRKSIEFAVAHRHRFIGVDLAGPEEGYPCRLYKDIFRKAHDAGLPVTVHAGEACGPENVWEAIDLLGAKRIGHGIHSVQDAELIRRLARDGILLETCPTSNYITRSVMEWPKHPLPQLLAAGVPVSINTDDPGIFGVPLGEEYRRCKKHLGLTDSDFAKIDAYAWNHSFLKAAGAQ